MIGYLVVYLITILVSLGINKYTKSSILKRIVEDGKYINKGVFDAAFDELFDVRVIEYLIPLYNIFKSMVVGTTIMVNYDSLYDTFKQVNALENIEKERQEEFEKDPTITKAKQLIKKHEKEIQYLSTIAFFDGSIIQFDACDDSIMRIKRTYGPISQEDLTSQMKRLSHAIDLFRTYLEACYQCISEGDMPEEVFKEVCKCQYNFDLTKIDDSISIEEFKKTTYNILHTVEDEYNDEYAKGIRRIRKK